MKYEDTRKDARKVITQIVDFVDQRLSDDELSKKARMTSLEEVKKNPATNQTDTPNFDMNISPFIRKGEVGDWKNHFTVAQNEYFDSLYQERMSGTGLQFDFK